MVGGKVWILVVLLLGTPIGAVAGNGDSRAGLLQAAQDPSQLHDLDADAQFEALRKAASDQALGLYLAAITWYDETYRGAVADYYRAYGAAVDAYNEAYLFAQATYIAAYVVAVDAYVEAFAAATAAIDAVYKPAVAGYVTAYGEASAAEQSAYTTAAGTAEEAFHEIHRKMVAARDGAVRNAFVLYGSTLSEAVHWYAPVAAAAPALENAYRLALGGYAAAWAATWEGYRVAYAQAEAAEAVVMGLQLPASASELGPASWNASPGLPAPGAGPPRFGTLFQPLHDSSGALPSLLSTLQPLMVPPSAPGSAPVTLVPSQGPPVATGQGPDPPVPGGPPEAHAPPPPALPPIAIDEDPPLVLPAEAPLHELMANLAGPQTSGVSAWSSQAAWRGVDGVMRSVSVWDKPAASPSAGSNEGASKSPAERSDPSPFQPLDPAAEAVDALRSNPENLILAVAAGVGSVTLLAQLVAWLGASSPVAALLSRKRGDEVLEHDLRTAIIESIRSKPGITLAQLVRGIDAQRSTVRYHVEILDREQHLRTRKAGRTMHLFDASLAVNDLPAMMCLANEQRRRIARFILDFPGTCQTDLVEATGLPASRVSSHIKRLERTDVVESLRDGKYQRYRPTQTLHILARELRQLA